MNEAPKVIYEAKGLKVVKNQGNQFCVITLHHSADPNKTSKEWRREAAAGMTIEQAARELDIDYTAILGAKVFPEILENRSTIVIPEPYPDFGPSVKYYAGFDYGTRNPSSFHVYTIVDGVIYCVWELFEPASNGPIPFVEKWREFPYFHQIRWIASDPAIFAPTQQAKEGLVSIADLIFKNGIRNLVKGIQDEDAWIAKLRQYWQNPEEPQFKIYSRCVNMVREFETAIYSSQSERQLMSSAYKESIADKDNHSLDDCKYFMSKAPMGNLQQQIDWNSGKMGGVGRWTVGAITQPTAPTKTDRGYRVG